MAPIGLVDEILRKGIHLTSVLIILIYAYAGKQFILAFLITYLVIILVIEHFRLEHGVNIPLFHFLFREKEESQLAGYVFFTIGAIISISVFSEMIAYTAILMTTFGDMSAALVGKSIGKTRIYNGKTIEGCVAEFVVDFCIGYAFIDNLFVVFIMAIVATIVEAVVGEIDDNLAIPVFSGFVGQGLVVLISWV